MPIMENRSCSASLFKLLSTFFFLVCCAVSGLSLNSGPEVLLHHGRKLSALVPSTPLVLQYHKGPLLTGPATINVYILWYGKFTPTQKPIITDFVSSLGATIPSHPSVSSWWATTQRYTDSAKQGVSRVVKIGGQVSDALYSVGKNLKRSDISLLVKGALGKRSFPLDARGIYIVLTADDVYVERFCMNSCGFHNSVALSKKTRILLGWVGNSGVQCPGQCAWPFAAPLYGPPTPPLIPPNGDVGVDGMIINIAAVLAGTATNPFNSGYYQGSALSPQEAVTACSGIFGKGAYPGYAGEVLVDKRSKGSYNAYGVNKRQFLVPGIWEPSQLACKTTMS